MEAVQRARISQNIGLASNGEWGWLGATLLTGSFEIDFWGKNRAGLEAATSEAMAAEADAAAARLTLAAQVASAYVDFARLEISRDLAASALKNRTQARDLVAVRLEAGTGPKQALEQADSAVESATARLRSVDEAIVLARHMIAALVGAGPDRGDRLTPPALVGRRSPAASWDLAVARAAPSRLSPPRTPPATGSRSSSGCRPASRSIPRSCSSIRFGSACR